MAKSEIRVGKNELRGSLRSWYMNEMNESCPSGSLICASIHDADSPVTLCRSVVPALLGVGFAQQHRPYQNLLIPYCPGMIQLILRQVS